MSSRHRISDLTPASETRARFNAALASVRAPELGSPFGLLFDAGKISEAEYNTGKKWAQLVVAYHVATRSPRGPATVAIDATGGSPIDPASERGAIEADRHRQVTAAYLAAKAALARAGRDAEAVVTHVVERDLAPHYSEIDALRLGLQALQRHWADRRQR